MSTAEFSNLKETLVNKFMQEYVGERIGNDPAVEV